MLFLEIGAIFFLIYGKKLITVPRLGQVTFGKKRKRRLVYILLANLGSLVFLAAVLAMKTSRPSLIDNDVISAIGMGVWITFITSVMAYFLDFSRLYIYALLYGATFALVLIFDLPILFLAASLLILIPGIVIFFQFLNTHEPIQEE
jgi:hypothetical protein